MLAHWFDFNLLDEERKQKQQGQPGPRLILIRKHKKSSTRTVPVSILSPDHEACQPAASPRNYKSASLVCPTRNRRDHSSPDGMFTPDNAKAKASCGTWDVPYVGLVLYPWVLQVYIRRCHWHDEVERWIL